MEFVIALITLTFLEIVLGIDNIIFISIVTNKLPKENRAKARFLGLFFALIFRVALLITLVWIIKHLTTFFWPMDGLSHEETLEKLDHAKDFWERLKIIPHAIGIRELILLIGGAFLLAKSVSEVYRKMEGVHDDAANVKVKSLTGIVIQILIIDIVFSFDSILTAVGITDNLPAMVSAVTISLVVMLFFSKKISLFISQHPSLEMLGLSFLILIGFLLTLESVHIDVPKGYIYFALFFSLAVELVNMKIRKKSKSKVNLHRELTKELEHE
jgi:predicted tellurium resistance membrane protein TerC